jgi:hypothetical protein
MLKLDVYKLDHIEHFNVDILLDVKLALRCICNRYIYANLYINNLTPRYTVTTGSWCGDAVQTY